MKLVVWTRVLHFWKVMCNSSWRPFPPPNGFTISKTIFFALISLWKQSLRECYCFPNLSFPPAEQESTKMDKFFISTYCIMGPRKFSSHPDVSSFRQNSNNKVGEKLTQNRDFTIEAQQQSNLLQDCQRQSMSNQY